MPLNTNMFKHRSAAEHAKAVRATRHLIDSSMFGYEQVRAELEAVAEYLENLSST